VGNQGSGEIGTIFVFLCPGKEQGTGSRMQGVGGTWEFNPTWRDTTAAIAARLHQCKGVGDVG